MFRSKLVLLTGILFLLSASVGNADDKPTSKRPIYRVKFPITNHQLNVDIPSETKVEQPVDLARQTDSTLSRPASGPSIN